MCSANHYFTSPWNQGRGERKDIFKHNLFRKNFISFRLDDHTPCFFLGEPRSSQRKSLSRSFVLDIDQGEKKPPLFQGHCRQELWPLAPDSAHLLQPELKWVLRKRRKYCNGPCFSSPLFWGDLAQHLCLLHSLKHPQTPGHSLSQIPWRAQTQPGRLQVNTH